MYNPCGAVCNSNHATDEDRARGVRVVCCCNGTKGHCGPHNFEMCRHDFDQLMTELFKDATLQ